jgi:sugar/nucleoside kinase (ribokinase family)
VFGSINIDIFLEVDRQPQIGETMSARKMTLGYGGKVIKQFLMS